MFKIISERFSVVLVTVYGNEIASKALNVAVKLVRLLST